MKIFENWCRHSSETLLVGDVLHRETFHVEDDGWLHYGIRRTLVLLEVWIHFGDAGFDQVNNVHDVIFLFGWAQNSLQVRHSVSNHPHWCVQKISVNVSTKYSFEFLRGLCTLSRPTKPAEKYFGNTSGGLNSSRMWSILCWRRHSSDWLLNQHISCQNIVRSFELVWLTVRSIFSALGISKFRAN